MIKQIFLIFGLFMSQAVFAQSQVCEFEGNSLKFSRQSWSAEILAHTNTNGVLNSMKQIRTRFSGTQNVLIGELETLRILDSNENPQLQLAKRMDRVFVYLLGAKRSVKNSVFLLSTALSESNKKVSWLADAVDCLYKFRGEK